MKQTIFRRCLLGLLAWVCLLQTTIGAFYDPYTDTDMLTKAEREVVTLVGDLGLMHGDGTSFRPHDAITREELFRVVYAISVGGGSTAPSNYYAEKLKAVQGLTDVDQIAAWALPYAGYCFFNKLFVGDENGALAPKKAVSYFDCAVVLLKLLGLPSTALEQGSVAANVTKFGLNVGLFDDLEIDNIYSPMTRLELAWMISAALESRCIASVSGDSLRFSTVNGLRRWFGISSVDKIRKQGVVTGQLTTKGVDYLLVSSGKTTLRYPMAGVSYGEVVGKIVRWCETASGEILSPLRLAAGEISAPLRELQVHRLENNSVELSFGSSDYFFEQNLFSGKTVRLYHTVTAEFETGHNFLTVTSLMEYLRSDIGALWGGDTVVSMSVTEEDLVVRITPPSYLRYDRAAQTVTLNGRSYPTDDAFAAVPDGAFVTVLLDAAAGEVCLLGLPQLVDAGSGAFDAECDEAGNYTFFINGKPVQNRTAMTTPVSDADLAVYAAVDESLDRYVLCDGDGIVAAGAFDDLGVPFADAGAYMLVERAESVAIGSGNYTALFGLINGKPDCALIAGAYSVPEIGENRLLYLLAEATSLGALTLRAQSVPAERDGLYGSVGFGTVTESVFASGLGREITVGTTELLLTDDCTVACADADGTPDTFRLEDILIFGGKAFDDQAGRIFRAVYGVNEDGAAEWLMLIRSEAK